MRTFVIDPSESGISGEVLAAAAMDLMGSPASLNFIADTIARAPYCTGWRVRYQPPISGPDTGYIRFEEGMAGPESVGDLGVAAREISSVFNLSNKAHEVLEGAVADLLRFDPDAGTRDLLECIVPDGT